MASFRFDLRELGISGGRTTCEIEHAVVRSPLDASTRPFAKTSTRSYWQLHAPFDYNARMHM